ncbi:dihydrolipoyl dehydrogenase [Candidatus Phytoplasma phoenicium]|uniref:Dihydrolipoyl dehydrogenase n=1 Tax=Candidatus Phytoplasma phoenicium TaxID=198422 RepID=A0A0L0MJ50_9MOLU|nr:dihydrolipoyl dehydrogenase [Candidatus Phytoplasma phoenicium]KND62672.1 Dihydrolipoamide dehydrogenase of pyruvate dehydrogenase complex [Candidatus Phytoplasma phoenicium]
MNKYDILIIGGGPGGYVAAIKASQLGAKVALVEEHKIGGICLNYGCIPTKAFLKSAKLFDFLQKIKTFGLNFEGPATFNWDAILARKNKIVKQLTNGISLLLKKNKIDVYDGTAEVFTPQQVKVGEQVLTTKKLIIATGSNAFIPPIPGAQQAYNNKYLYTSKELVQLEKFPQKIIIIGGGIIGVEFATVFNKFGAEVIILEKQNSILHTLDQDVSRSYTQKLKKDKIQILTDASVMKIQDNTVTYAYENEEHRLKADIILMAVGTRPNLYGLQKLNLVIDRQGIVTDRFLRTSIDDVYAIGDVNGKYMLAHVASHEGMIAVSHALLGEKQYLKPMNYYNVPSCIYGFPEIAVIGLTEQQVKEQNLDFKVFKMPVRSIGKALADGETEGFSKIIVEAKSLKILGMHIFAYNATELISEIGLAMELEGTAYDVAHTIHPHPTLSELTLETVLGVIDKPIHM